MANGWRNGRAPRDFAKRMQARAAKVARESNTVAGQALQMLRGDSARRERAAVRRVNKQDSPSGRETRPGGSAAFSGDAITRDGSAVVKFRVSAYWAGARSRALRAVYGSVRLIQTLFRRSLLVRARGALQRLFFARVPRLAGWAARADRSQYLAHVTRVRGEALRRLRHAPLVRLAETKIVAYWKSRVKTGLR